MSKREPLTFLASIAPLQSAITIASDGGARVKVDIPESEMGAVVRLMGMRNATLRLTVEIEVNRTDERETTQSKTVTRAAGRPTDLAGS